MSKERLLLVGAGGFGRVVSELARQSFDCAFVDDGVEVGTIICDIPVIGQTADLHNLFAEYKNLVIVIGNNSVRERIYNMAKRIGYIFPNLISSSAYISPYAKLGWGCVILNNAVIQNRIVCRKWCAAQSRCGSPPRLLNRRLRFNLYK